MSIKKKKFNNLLVFLVLVNVLLFSSIVINWYSANEIKKNFNNFSDQMGKNLQSLSQEANNLNKELGGIQEKLGDLTKTIDELGNIEKELGVSNNNLSELRESLDNISQGLEEKLTDLTKGGGEIKDSLDNVSEIRNELNKLMKLRNDLGNLTKLANGLGKTINSKEIGKIKEEIGNLVAAMGKFDSIVCSDCQGLKLSSLIRGDSHIVREEKWRKLFREGKMALYGEIEEIEYWRTAGGDWLGSPSKPKSKIIGGKSRKVEISMAILEEIKKNDCQDSYPEVLETPTLNEIPKSSAKKFTLKEKKKCDLCLQKIKLENLNKYNKQKVIELLMST